MPLIVALFGPPVVVWSLALVLLWRQAFGPYLAMDPVTRHGRHAARVFWWMALALLVINVGVMVAFLLIHVWES